MSATETALQTAAQRTEFGVQETRMAGVDTAGTALAAQARAMVESRYVMAMRKPRNWDEVRQKLLEECRRPSFAHNKSALYHKPIGDGVEGLGIRFAEVALRCMTNVLVETSMIYEDETKEVHRVSVTDLESNDTHYQDIPVRKTVERSKPDSDGGYISVRMNNRGRAVYTVPANDDDLLNKRAALISKALRMQALRIIPGDLQDEAEAIIRQVRLDQAAQDPNAERKRIADAFASVGVRVKDLEDYLGHGLDQFTPAELTMLRGLYGALKDGEATWKSVMENKVAQDAAGEKEESRPQPTKAKGSAVEKVREEAEQQRVADTKRTDPGAMVDAQDIVDAAAPPPGPTQQPIRPAPPKTRQRFEME